MDYTRITVTFCAHAVVWPTNKPNPYLCICQSFI